MSRSHRDKRAPAGMPVGEAHHSAKLTEDRVRALRYWHYTRKLCKKCAWLLAAPNISRSSAFDAITFVTWKHVK